MEIINPNSELWFQPSDWMEQVQRSAIVCYGKEESKKPAWQTCDSLLQHGHNSMFRHATHYYLFERRSIRPVIPNYIYQAIAGSEYCSVCRSKSILNDVLPKDKATAKERRQKDPNGLMGTYFIVLNHNYLIDHPEVDKFLLPHEVTLADYVLAAKALNCNPALDSIRFTLCSVTQISTSREYNRLSPNAIAEQSTRFVNFDKKEGGITICRPHWYLGASGWLRFMARLCWKSQQWFYSYFLRHGLPPQDARTALGLDTATRVVYTYSIREWRHILDLRLKGTTGKPHPNAKELAELLLPCLQRAVQVAIGDDYSVYN